MSFTMPHSKKQLANRSTDHVSARHSLAILHQPVHQLTPCNECRHQPSGSRPSSDWRSWLLPDNTAASSSSHSFDVNDRSTSSTAFGSLNAAHAPSIPEPRSGPSATLAGPQADWRSWLSPDLVPGSKSGSTTATLMQHTGFAHVGSSNHGNLASDSTEPAAPSCSLGLGSTAPSQEAATASSFSPEAGMLHADARFTRTGDAYPRREQLQRGSTHLLHQGSPADHDTASNSDFVSISRSKAQDQESDRISRIMSIGRSTRCILIHHGAELS